MNTLIKIVLTIVLVMIAGYPYFENGEMPGGLNEIQQFGLVPSIFIVSIFFIAIAFYCHALQKILESMKPENQTRNPKSVWYMYLLPFNFIEDFFIVIDIANSLRNETRTNKNLLKFGDFGLTLGLGWAIAQLFSFIPNIVGQISGGIGLILWIFHWVLIHKIHKELQLANTQA